MMTVLYIVVPCYNEDEVLPETAKRLGEKLHSLIASERISDESRVLFVNDGSKDKTWELITEFHRNDVHFSGVNLSRNRGHQNALLAGLMTARDKCSCAISMDADLQDDIDAVDEMIEKFADGCDVVYGVRKGRKTDSAFKRTTAHSFYKLMEAMGVELVYDSADYRLMSRRALEALSEFDEVNLFLRGLVPLIGFKSDKVYYERGERFAGESKYPLKKMLSFAMDGITSFSVKPIGIISVAGLILIIVAACMLAVFIIMHAAGNPMTWAKGIFAAVFAVGGIQLIATGVVGEYVGKIYMESKHRPKYFIQDYLE